MDFGQGSLDGLGSPELPIRTRSWTVGGDGAGARRRSRSPVSAERYGGRYGRTSSADWVGDADPWPQWRGRSPALAGRRGRGELPAQSPARARHEWSSPKRELGYSPTAQLRSSSPRRHRAAREQARLSPSLGGSPQTDRNGAPLSSDVAAAARSDAIIQLRHEFSQREGRYCDRKWAKRALVKVNYTSVEDFSAAYSWLLENVNELEMEEPVGQPSSLAKWFRSIADWLEVAPREDVQTYQEWKHERITRPAWSSFRCETEDLHSLWGGRWETPYYLGLEAGDYIEVDDQYAQFTLWTMDGSAVRLAAEGTDLRLLKGTPLARKLKEAFEKDVLCVVKVVRTDQGLERIRDAEVFSWKDPTITVMDQSSLSNDSDGGSDDGRDAEMRGQSAPFELPRQSTQKKTSRKSRVSLTLRITHYKMLRVFSRWADLADANQGRRRARTLMRERNLDLLNRVWVCWCRYVRGLRRQRQQHRWTSPASARGQHKVGSLPRSSSGGRARRTPEIGRAPGRTGSGRSPTRPSADSSRRSVKSTANRSNRERSKLRPSSSPPASSASGSSPDEYPQTVPTPRRSTSPSRTRSRSAAQSPGRNPSRIRSPEHRLRNTGRSQHRSPSRSRARSSARSSIRSPSHHRPSSPQYRTRSTGRGRDQPRRTKSGPMTLQKGQRRGHELDPARDHAFDRRRLLRASDTDDTARERRKREAKREAKLRKDKQRKRDIADRLARIERDEMDRSQRKHHTGSLTDQDRLQRPADTAARRAFRPNAGSLTDQDQLEWSTDAAARRVFEYESNPTAVNLKTFVNFRTKNSPSRLVADEEIQACREIWERFEKNRGAVKRADLAAILAEMVHRGHITISDDGIIIATDDQPKRPTIDRSNDRQVQQGTQESQSETQPRLSKRLDSDGVKDLKRAAEVAKTTGRVTRLKDGVLELEFVDDATTGLHFSRRRFSEAGENSGGETYFMVAGTRKDSEAARMESCEGIVLSNLLLDTVDGAVVEVDDTYAAKVEETFIKQARPVKLTLVPKEAYQRRAAGANSSKPRPSPTTPRATPRTAHKSDPGSRNQVADDRGDVVQQGRLAKWERHPELQEAVDRWCPPEMPHGDRVLESMEEKLINVECVAGQRTETLPITWWPKKSESDALVVKDIDMSMHGPFAKVFQDRVTQGMILATIGAQDCSKIGYGKSIDALKTALMPRKRTKLQFLSLQVRDAADDEPVDDGVDAVGYARAIDDFDGTQDGDLPIRRDDFIVVLAKTDENWWHGYIEGHPETEGAFPCGEAFVEELAEDEWRRHQQSVSPSLQLEQYCRSCREIFASAQCPRRHSDSQYLPKQMAMQQGLYVDKGASTTSGRSPPATREETNQTSRATPAGGLSTLTERQKAVVNKLKSKLSAQAYGRQGQDPYTLFKKYDRNNDGALDFQEFKDAVRKGGQVTSSMLSDAEVRQVFQIIDADNNATLSVDELTKFIWGDEGSNAEESMALFKQLWDYAKNVVQKKTGFTVPDDGGTVLWRKISNGRSSVSMADFDAGIKRNELKLYSQECVKIAFKAADDTGDRSIQRSEFRMLLEYLVLFCGLEEVFNTMNRNRSGRLTRVQFSQGIQRQIGGTMTDDDIERAFVAIDLDAGGSIRFSELCTWAGAMLQHLRESTAAPGAGNSPHSEPEDADTPDYKWYSHPQLKRLLQDKTLDDMCERTVVLQLTMGPRISPLGITWWPMKSEKDSLVVKAIDVVRSPFAKELEQVTECMVLSKVNDQDCRSGYTKSKQLLEAALKPRRRVTLEFLCLEPKVDDGSATREVLSYVRAVADYQSETAGDLSFVAGDLIAVTGKDEEEWWHGYLDSKPEVEGMFPWKEYVEEADGPQQVQQPEPEPEPEPPQQANRKVMYCKACRKTFATEFCPARHAALDQKGGENYITQSVAIKERWPNSQLTAQQLQAFRSSPRYPGTGASTSTGSTPRQPATQTTTNAMSNSAALTRTATAKGAASAPRAVAQAKNKQYCKACRGCFASPPCPNNHRSFNYLAASEASGMPGWNSTAVKTVAR